MIAVVKLGGSLAASQSLQEWLAVVVLHGRGRAVIVPGGGVFADAVRTAQRSLGFSDLAAHRMALLAMDQYALLLGDIEPSLRLCASLPEIERALADGAAALWRPSGMVEAATEVAASWDVTSDSLAAWLARRLGADRLLLVKSATAPAPHHPEHLAALGLVDAAFPAYMAAAGLRLGYFGPGEQAKFAEDLETAGADA